MAIRNATIEDVSRMAELSRIKRAEYEKYSPLLWKTADRPIEAHALYLRELVENEDTITLVSEDNDIVNGFLIGSLVDAPAVYDPGGKVCMVDDYVVGDPDLWSSVGISLLDLCRTIAKSKRMRFASGCLCGKGLCEIRHAQKGKCRGDFRMVRQTVIAFNFAMHGGH